MLIEKTASKQEERARDGQMTIHPSLNQIIKAYSYGGK
jgi:hypothetical protein